ncbi:MAG: apolipoprotein N-acyltransferase [Vicinamibacterales bacterium]
MLYAVSFPKFGHPAFAWITLAPLLVAVAMQAVTGVGLRRVFFTGVLTGGVGFLGTIYWVVGTMHTYGGLALPVALPVGLLLVAYLAIYPGIFAVLTAVAVRRLGVAGVWLSPLFWVATEWLRGVVGGGFPWVYLGTSQATSLPVAQLASLVGVYGLSALVALVGAAAAAVALSRRRVHLAGAGAVALLLVAVVAFGAFRLAGSDLTRTGRVLRVGLVQGNVPQDQKWDPVYRQQILDRYMDLSRRVIGAGAGLVVWPEASTPFFFDLDLSMAEPVRRLAMQSGTPFVIGTDEFEPGHDGVPDRIYNSAVLVGRDGRTRATYRKMQLVPFGEYVPLKRLLFFVGPLVEAVSDFSPGTSPVVLEADDLRVSTAICYESIFPWIARAFVDHGSELLMTITNDAWFGTSSAAYQHWDQGALRAIEEGRYVVRAANTGFSGVVDPYGRVTVRSRLFESDALTADVRLLDGRTLYNRLGDVVVWLSLAVSAIMVGVAVLRRRRR